MSIISGYPVGAKLTSDLYREKKLTKGQAKSITAFTSTSGPLFILGTLSVGLFQNIKSGVIILISHYISAILNGLLYKCKNKDDSITIQNIPVNKQKSFSDCVANGITAILNIGGFIALFYMIIQLLLTLDIFSPLTLILSKVGISNKISECVFAGLIEVTTGEILLSQLNLSMPKYTIISSFLISFGGLSIHAQAYTYLQQFNMPYKEFLLQKLTHASLSTLISILILCIV
ncbi:MAG: hypothetical protein E7354_02660 [Clostridiales bacterium]|nr:hypothetical protein [Clostridiales bacterium]